MNKNRDEKRRLLITVFFVLGLALLTWVLYHLAGIEFGCYTRAFTGLPCPGCGMTRAWLCALRLDFKSAFFYHPLFLLPVAVVLLLFLKTACGISVPNRIWVLFLVLFLSVYVIRMILYFPHTAPMTFDPDAYLPRLLYRIKSLL